MARAGCGSSPGRRPSRCHAHVDGSVTRHGRAGSAAARLATQRFAAVDGRAPTCRRCRYAITLVRPGGGQPHAVPPARSRRRCARAVASGRPPTAGWWWPRTVVSTCASCGPCAVVSSESTRSTRRSTCSAPRSGSATCVHHFDDVRWLAFPDSAGVHRSGRRGGYVCSTPPGEDATDEQLARLGCRGRPMLRARWRHDDHHQGHRAASCARGRSANRPVDAVRPMSSGGTWQSDVP